MTRRANGARLVTRVTGYRIVAERSAADVAQEHARRLPVRTPRDVMEMMAPIAAQELAEVFWLVLLDSQHKAIGGAPVVVSRGVLNMSLVHPREVFRAAILADGCAALILVHNHPSGDPTPSVDDRVVTDQMVAAGRLLDMPVHDHIIIGAGRYCSFAEAGLL